jgi:hypothetical protein
MGDTIYSKCHRIWYAEIYDTIAAADVMKIGEMGALSLP